MSASRRWNGRLLIAVCLSLCSLCPGIAFAKGIDPDRINRISIHAKVQHARPWFTLIFSEKPLAGLMPGITGQCAGAERKTYEGRNDVLVLRVGGKSAMPPDRFDYSLGRKNDGDAPWNNGAEFHWQSWATYSDEIWDNVAILYQAQSQTDEAILLDVSLQRGGMLLFDSRKKRSYSNGHPVDFRFAPQVLRSAEQGSSVLDLSRAMQAFRRDYYETKGNPLLVYAYNDLAQTDRTKYSMLSRGWCSEFIAHVYRANGIDAPDPNAREINWFILKDWISRGKGKIYPLRELAQWSAEEKTARIRPGSVVSIVTGTGASHTLLFAAWNTQDNLASFSAISGNNRGMVWSHPFIKIPMPDVWGNMSARELVGWDARSYIAVPAKLASE